MFLYYAVEKGSLKKDNSEREREEFINQGAQKKEKERETNPQIKKRITGKRKDTKCKKKCIKT